MIVGKKHVTTDAGNHDEDEDVDEEEAGNHDEEEEHTERPLQRISSKTSHIGRRRSFKGMNVREFKKQLQAKMKQRSKLTSDEKQVEIAAKLAKDKEELAKARKIMEQAEKKIGNSKDKIQNSKDTEGKTVAQEVVQNPQRISAEKELADAQRRAMELEQKIETGKKEMEEEIDKQFEELRKKDHKDLECSEAFNLKLRNTHVGDDGSYTFSYGFRAQKFWPSGDGRAPKRFAGFMEDDTHYTFGAEWSVDNLDGLDEWTVRMGRFVWSEDEKRNMLVEGIKVFVRYNRMSIFMGDFSPVEDDAKFEEKLKDGFVTTNGKNADETGWFANWRTYASVASPVSGGSKWPVTPQLVEHVFDRRKELGKHVDVVFLKTRQVIDKMVTFKTAEKRYAYQHEGEEVKSTLIRSRKGLTFTVYCPTLEDEEEDMHAPSYFEFFATRNNGFVEVVCWDKKHRFSWGRNYSLTSMVKEEEGDFHGDGDQLSNPRKKIEGKMVNMYSNWGMPSLITIRNTDEQDRGRPKSYAEFAYAFPRRWNQLGQITTLDAESTILFYRADCKDDTCQAVVDALIDGDVEETQFDFFSATSNKVSVANTKHEQPPLKDKLHERRLQAEVDNRTFMQKSHVLFKRLAGYTNTEFNEDDVHPLHQIPMALYRGTIVDGMFLNGTMLFLHFGKHHTSPRFAEFNGFIPQSCLLEAPAYHVRNGEFVPEKDIEKAKDKVYFDLHQKGRPRIGQTQNLGGGQNNAQVPAPQPTPVQTTPQAPPQQQVWELLVKATFSGKDAVRRCSTNDQKNAKRQILQYVRALFDALSIIAKHPTAAWHDSELQRAKELLEIGRPMLGSNLQERMDEALKTADNGENNLSMLRKNKRTKVVSLPAPCYEVNNK